LRALLEEQLRGGLGPDELALAIGLGFACGLFPIFGATTALSAIAGVAFRVNQVVVQAVNYLVYPIYFFVLAGLLAAGAWVFDEPLGDDVVAQMRALLDQGLRVFVAELGRALLHAVVVWAVLAPFTVVAVRQALRPILRRWVVARAS
jgi:uncharacterized protein (DUF2062 family)